MIRMFFAGGWYCDADPTGAVVVLFPESHLLTHLGQHPLPDGEAFGVLFPRLTTIGGFRYAGASHDHPTGHPLRYERVDGRWISTPAVYEGTSPVIYDLIGALRANNGSAGSQGYRYVAADGTPAGRLVTGDETYFSPSMGLSEFTMLADDLAIGQAHADDADNAAWIWDRGVLRWLGTVDARGRFFREGRARRFGWRGRDGRFHAEGASRFIRGVVVGDKVALAMVTTGGASIYQATIAELRALPAVADVPDPPEPPDPKPPDPDGEFMEPWKVDIAEYGKRIAAGEQWTVTTNLGNGVSVVVEKTGGDSLHIAVSKDGVQQDRSGAERHVDVVGPPTPVPPEPPTPLPPTVTDATLQTHNGHFFYAPTDGNAVNALALDAASATRFVFERVGDKTAIRTASGKYLRADQGGEHGLYADRDTPHLDPAVSDELFTLTQNGAAIAIQSRRGFFVAAEGGGGGAVSVDRTSAGVWETFVVDPPDALGSVAAESGPLYAGVDVFVDDAGAVWSYRGVSAFLLFFHWLHGESIDAFVDWSAKLGANTLRVLGMVYWPPLEIFGPGINGNYWDQLLPFIDYVGARGLRVEFVVFASAQDIMPDADDQRQHLRRVVDLIGGRWNVLIEVANEPQQNGVDPAAIFDEDDPRDCPMAYGLYELQKAQQADGTWLASLPVLDYLTAHTPRDADAWSRKAKDLSEYRDGSGDGSEVGPLYPGCHIPPVGDEPMGAAEAADCAGRQRSNISADFFWYAANAAINGAGSTFHSDAGLDAVVPPPDGDQQKCADACALAWSNVPADIQTGSYTRGGLPDLPLVWQAEYFPEQTSRIYGRILGNRAVCVGIKPNAGWTPTAAAGWRIVATFGPQASLVHLERA